MRVLAGQAGCQRDRQDKGGRKAALCARICTLYSSGVSNPRLLAKHAGLLNRGHSLELRQHFTEVVSFIAKCLSDGFLSIQFALQNVGVVDELLEMLTPAVLQITEILNI